MWAIALAPPSSDQIAATPSARATAVVGMTRATGRFSVAAMSLARTPAMTEITTAPVGSDADSGLTA